MSYSDDLTTKCPYCGHFPCHADFVDIGVGYEQVSPYICGECDAIQINPYHCDWDELTEEEKKTGWQK